MAGSDVRVFLVNNSQPQNQLLDGKQRWPSSKKSRRACCHFDHREKSW